MNNKKIDLSKRQFIKGVTSVYAAGNIMLLPGGHNILSQKQNEIYSVSTSDCSGYKKNYYHVPNYALGAAATGFLLSNLDYIYSVMIILIATTVFLFFGIPGIEYLQYSSIQQIVLSY